MQFWSNEPTILLNKEYIFELWPTNSMCYEQKLNAISRLIILFTILGFILTMSWRIVIVGIITMGIIFFVWKQKMEVPTEGFQKKRNIVTNLNNNKFNKKMPSATTTETTTNPITLETMLKSEFQMGTKKNPMSNVLLTEIMDNPERKSAPPAFNPDVYEDITNATKKTVQYLNPGIKNTNKQLFSSMTDKFYLDQSNRAFFSNPSTKIPNDQGAFADFLYGDMPSCKDGDGIQCVKDSYRYILL